MRGDGRLPALCGERHYLIAGFERRCLFEDRLGGAGVMNRVDLIAVAAREKRG